MKTHLHVLVALAGWLVCTPPASSQGTLEFGNHIPLSGIDAPVFDVDCATRLEGEGFQAQVYVGLSPDSLRPVGLVQPFRTGINAGYIRTQYLVIPGALGGMRVFTQLRAWETRAGASFEEAVATGGKYGLSNIVPIKLVEPPGSPPHPLGLQSFCLVPEPGPGTLLALGGGLWLLAARRRTESHRL